MKPAGARGFTLVELLVAIAVLAVIAVLSTRGLGSILDARASTEAESRRWTDVALLIQQMERDLSLAVGLPTLDADGALVLTRLGDADATPQQSGSRRVGYRLRGEVVQYLVWPAGAPDAPPAVHDALEAAAAMRFRVLGADGAWRPLEPAPPAVFPRAIELQLDLPAGRRITRIFALR